jgi:hypothetical protein
MFRPFGHFERYHFLPQAGPLVALNGVALYGREGREHLGQIK